MMDEMITKEMARRIIDSPRNKKQMLRMLESIPSAVPRGKWKNIVDGIEYTWGTCDTCGAHIPMAYKYYEFCPHCGAKNEVTE